MAGFAGYPRSGVIPVAMPSRRIPDFLSIAAAGILPSRRIPDFLSINEGRDKARRDGFKAALLLPFPPARGRRAKAGNRHGKPQLATNPGIRLQSQTEGVTLAPLIDNKEPLVYAEVTCGAGMCRPESNHLAMTPVIRF